jgi:hypothetical protein
MRSTVHKADPAPIHGFGSVDPAPIHGFGSGSVSDPDRSSPMDFDPGIYGFGFESVSDPGIHGSSPTNSITEIISCQHSL